jgi:glycosyltransferase involved in cell wall biosynthesis
MTPSLSLCIATLNRAPLLARMLDSIAVQAGEEVEIAVVDGASTDGTPQVVAEVQRRFPRLRYLRLAEKGGVDRDYDRAVELARGRYCWLLSDDDVLKPGAVAAVLAATRSHYDLVVVNAEGRNADLTRVIDDRRLHVSADRVWRPAEQERFFAETAYYLSFIGGVVVRREVWLARDRQSYFGTAFVHIGVLFQRPLDGDVLVLAEPWIALRLGAAEWSSRAFEIWMFKWPRLVWSFAQFSEAARAAVARREPWRRPTALLRFRARGAYTEADYRQFLAGRLESPLARALALAVARVPLWLANVIGLAFYSVVRPSEVERLDLRTSPAYFRRAFSGGPAPR